jgi:peptide/nickel transport system substrate-binding protein
VNNWGRWNDPTLDKLLEDQRATLDFAKRKAIVYDAQRRILDQIPRMYIYDWVTFTAMHEKLRDFEPAAYSTFAGWDQFKQVWFAK